MLGKELILKQEQHHCPENKVYNVVLLLLSNWKEMTSKKWLKKLVQRPVG